MDWAAHYCSFIRGERMTRSIPLADVVGWSLVGISLIGGIYSCWLFDSVLASPIAQMIIKIFI